MPPAPPAAPAAAPAPGAGLATLAELQQALLLMALELTDLSRFLYSEARATGNTSAMIRARHAGELFKQIESQLSPD